MPVSSSRPDPSSPARPGRHRAGGRHRAPVRSLGERLPEVVTSVPALGGLAGSLTVMAASVLPGAAGTALASDNTSSRQASQPASVALVAVPANARFSPPTDHDLARLRMCESTGNYSVNTGNGFYGAYQFDLPTWAGLGLAGMPQQAEPALQDAAAGALEQTRGWQPWPSCSSHLGLQPQRAQHTSAAQTGAVDTISTTGATSAGSAASAVAGVSAADTASSAQNAADVAVAVAASDGNAATASQASPASVPVPSAPSHTATPPPFPGRVLSLADVKTYRSYVRTWQQRMAARGWRITADGYFGPQSQHVARAFASQKGLAAGLPGEVGATLWAAAWTSPVD